MNRANETIQDYIKRKGLKHTVVAHSMDMKTTTWYKNRIDNCRSISVEEIHKLSKFLRVSPCRAFELIYNLYSQSLPKQLKESETYLEDC